MTVQIIDDAIEGVLVDKLIDKDGDAGWCLRLNGPSISKEAGDHRNFIWYEMTSTGWLCARAALRDKLEADYNAAKATPQ